MVHRHLKNSNSHRPSPKSSLSRSFKILTKNLRSKIDEIPAFEVLSSRIARVRATFDHRLPTSTTEISPRTCAPDLSLARGGGGGEEDISNVICVRFELEGNRAEIMKHDGQCRRRRKYFARFRGSK